MRPRPRVLWLTNVVPFPPHGGVQLRVFNLITRIARDYDVTAGCLDLDYVLRHLTAQASSVTMIDWTACALVTGAVAFAVVRFQPRMKRSLRATLCLLAALWAVGQAGFLIALPLTTEVSRYALLSIAPLVFLTAGALALAQRAWQSRGIPGGEILGAAACGLALALFGPVRVATTVEYAAAIDSIPRTESGPVILVQSDEVGEGAMIAARLEQDSRAGGHLYVLRSSKLLADSSWSGSWSELKFDNPGDVARLLAQIPVDYVVIDSKPPPSVTENLLRQAVASDGTFARVARLPVVARARTGEVSIYKRQSPGRAGPVELSVTLAPERGHRELACR